MFHNVGEEILEDLVFFLPLEGNFITAQDHPTLYTYLKWREGQRGVDSYVYHVQILSPPTLHEFKVEEHFQELPCWEIAHLIWMISWGMEDPHGEYVPQHISESMPWEETVQLYPLQLLEDKQHLGGEDCNVPIYHIAKWNIKVFFLTPSS